MSSVLPNGYYYTFLFFDMVMPGIFGVMTLFNPYQAFSDPLPLGYDTAGDLLVGRESPRVALAVLLGAVMGPVWAITTGLLLPLAKNGMEDRPDLAEKVVRAHLVSGAIVDPFHVMALAYYYPTNLLLSPKNWSPMVPVGFIWATGIGALKIAWCLGYGRATAQEMMTKRKVKDWAGKVGPVGGVDKAL